HMIVHRKQLALDELRLRGLAQPDGDVGLAHGKVQLIVAEKKRDRYFRIKIEEFADQRREPATAEADRCRDAQNAVGPFAAVGEQRLGGFELGEQFLRGAVEEFAL